ncbi:MAG: macB 3 [Candidatus Aminicenantes bacterium]|nr:macB 3 [Candidatus Aminicenantes bacterium]
MKKISVFAVAYKNLLRKRTRSLLTVLGIAMAAWVLVSLFGFNKGYEASLNRDIDNLGFQMLVVAKGCPYEAATLMLKGGTGLKYMDESIAASVAAEPEVDGVTPMLMQVVFDPNKGESGGVAAFLGVDPVTFPKLKSALPFKAGGWFQAPEAAEAVFGYEVAELEQREVGDLYLIPEKEVEVKVVGILERTGTQDDGTIFLPIKTVQKIFGLRQLTSIGIKVKKDADLKAFEDKMYKLPDVQVVSLSQVKTTIMTLVSTARVMVFSIAPADGRPGAQASAVLPERGPRRDRSRAGPGDAGRGHRDRPGQRDLPVLESGPDAAAGHDPQRGAVVSARAAFSIEAEHLRRVYRRGQEEIAAVDDVSLRIERGSFLSVVGPSGSGKTTLINVLGCLDNPTSGRLTLGGRVVFEDRKGLSEAKLTRIRRDVFGYIFQKFYLISTLTVLENVILPFTFFRKPGAEEDVGRVLKLLGLDKRAGHLPGQLSGGEMQRVAIARALVNKPEILLADEPTGNLDTARSEEIGTILKDLNERQGLTVILVTHNPRLAALAGRTIELQDGRIRSA